MKSTDRDRDRDRTLNKQGKTLPHKYKRVSIETNPNNIKTQLIITTT